jgi:hypothetical protein
MSPLTPDEKKTLRRIADDPTYFIRYYFKELESKSHDGFFDLMDRLKAVWQDIRETRIDLCFVLNLEPAQGTIATQAIEDAAALQNSQQQAAGKRVFEIDLAGNVIGFLDFEDEAEPVALRELSRSRGIVAFWLGPDFDIFCKGYVWTPKNKKAVLREIKSRKRRKLLSMTDYTNVLRTHFENFVRDEARVKYWFTQNELLQPSPENIFQQSLWSFIDLEVDCIEAEREPMFKDSSRCDIKITTENYDIYFIEVKWIGKSAVKKRKTKNIEGADPHEFDVGRAIDGAYQTKTYIEKNNSTEYENRIKLGIYLVYDAYSPPQVPIDYGDEIRKYVLLKPVEFPLFSISPSKATKGIAKNKGLTK